jgi:hypothetical protein
MTLTQRETLRAVLFLQALNDTPYSLLTADPPPYVLNPAAAFIRIRTGADGERMLTAGSESDTGTGHLTLSFGVPLADVMTGSRP